MFARVTLLLCLFAPLAARAGDDESKLDRVKAIEALRPSVVWVQYYLQYSQGDPPTGLGYQTKCPACGRYHNYDALANYLTEDRPLETVGYLVEPQRVIAPDVVIHPRFIREVRVRQGESSVAASIAGFAIGESAITLSLAAPLAGAAALTMAPAGAGKLEAMTWEPLAGGWTTTLMPVSDVVTVSTLSPEHIFRSVSPQSVVIDDNAATVWISMNGELPPKNADLGKPLANMEALPQAAYAELCTSIERLADQGLPRVLLRFRSPQGDAPGVPRWRRYHYGNDDQAGVTEMNVTGVLLGEKRLLVLAALDPDATKRLESIRVEQADGESVVAAFEASLKDYGALVASLERPLPGAFPPSKAALLTLKHRLLPAVEVRQFGETRQTLVAHARIRNFDIGFKGRTYPELGGSPQNIFLFDRDGGLLTLPLPRRSPASERENWRPPDTTTMPFAYVIELLDQLVAHADPSNVPLSEEQENRTAWLGVELQALDRDLARENKASKLTRDGATGALVSYVYPDSPAAKAGVENGWILLRLHDPARPKPIEVSAPEQYDFDLSLAWEGPADLDLDDDMGFSMRPWPSMSSPFNQLITEIGFGKPFEAEFFHDGQTIRKSFTVAESPSHFDAAAKYKSESLGLTIRDLTFEVRRHFRYTPEDPGVIIAKIERGSRASVAGLRRYELVTTVNDAPVRSAKDFESAMKNASGELRLGVKRLHQARIVKIDLAAPPPAKPADEDEEDKAAK